EERAQRGNVAEWRSVRDAPGVPQRVNCPETFRREAHVRILLHHLDEALGYHVVARADADPGCPEPARHEPSDDCEYVVNDQRRPCRRDVARNRIGEFRRMRYVSTGHRYGRAVGSSDRISPEEIVEDAAGLLDGRCEDSIRKHVDCGTAAREAGNDLPQSLEMPLPRHAEYGVRAPGAIRDQAFAPWPRGGSQASTLVRSRRQRSCLARLTRAPDARRRAVRRILRTCRSARARFPRHARARY